MPDETAEHISEQYSNGPIGILGTTGSILHGLYQDPLHERDIDTLTVGRVSQEALVQSAIFDPIFGVKAHSQPVMPEARSRLLQAICQLAEAGARAVVLGCTEIPLAVPEPSWDSIPLIDPNLVLARALIHKVAPDKLRAVSEGVA